MKKLLGRWPLFCTALLLSGFMLMGGWCERYEAKQRRHEYKKRYLDTMRVKAERMRDSVRAAEKLQDSSARAAERPDSLRRAQE